MPTLNTKIGFVLHTGARYRRGVIVALAALVALALLLPAAVNASPQSVPANSPTPEDKPTVVLVHGAFADSSSWNGVIPRLKREGYPVFSVANPLRGLQEDAAHLRTVLDSVEGPIVLAGHSYGGSVMSEAAESKPDVKALVYVASFQLDIGESTGELAGKFPGGELGPVLQPVAFETPDGRTGNDLYVKQEEFRRVFAADISKTIAELMAATQRPIAETALQDTATKAAWKTIPSWSMITTKDLAIPAESMRFMAERANAEVVEIDASHGVTVSEPRAVADLITKAAHEVTQ
ncbi:alpha/beta hydrolase [Arthrobacter sp. MSA 4-2]|uniref:alpha/beta fold hydrolase n=1 Tax=Arthrobacter sp. MSA 4-2 TaxID=2794349 RepID=UPI0018E903A3|nr:alpha/beta hydrolase [Arthrobacter sp. MSA 4-2]MBJ2120654.1 alpha/beta hydrolase [Arthrobacter sp. MSA 4-2]